MSTQEDKRRQLIIMLLEVMGKLQEAVKNNKDFLLNVAFDDENHPNQIMMGGGYPKEEMIKRWQDGQKKMVNHLMGAKDIGEAIKEDEGAKEIKITKKEDGKITINFN